MYRKITTTFDGQQFTNLCDVQRTMRVLYNLFRARILKHSMEAEKSAFQGELSFLRSECTAGLTVATTFFVASKDYLCKQSIITLKLAKMIYIFILYLKYLETFLGNLALTLSALLSF